MTGSALKARTLLCEPKATTSRDEYESREASELGKDCARSGWGGGWRMMGSASQARHVAFRPGCDLMGVGGGDGLGFSQIGGWQIHLVANLNREILC